MAFKARLAQLVDKHVIASKNRTRIHVFAKLCIISLNTRSYQVQIAVKPQTVSMSVTLID